VRPDVSIVVVARDSARDLPACRGAARAQAGVATELLVVDNASTDASSQVAERQGARVIALSENTGFAGGANAGIARSQGRYVLTLNPDCRLEPDFCARLAGRLDRPDASDVGSASGRLLRAQGEGLAATDRLDSTGIYFTACGRHLDRDSGAPAAEARTRSEEIAGVTGAAGFYRREALDSVRISSGWFDEDFFLYREDADLALRLRAAGWRCLYVADAVAYHRRTVLPGRRRRAGALANYHSVKNRFLLRWNNQPVPEFRILPTFLRDVLVVGACLTTERESLPALGYVWRNRRRLRAKRAEIAARRR
jgi:GT2 family glycosyltransferase